MCRLYLTNLLLQVDHLATVTLRLTSPLVTCRNSYFSFFAQLIYNWAIFSKLGHNRGFQLARKMKQTPHCLIAFLTASNFCWSQRFKFATFSFFEIWQKTIAVFNVNEPKLFFIRNRVLPSLRAVKTFGETRFISEIKRKSKLSLSCGVSPR